MDWSTINIDELRKLQTYKLPATYRISDGTGNGCLGNPPGYPTYFTKLIYTRYGTLPRRSPHIVINFEKVNYVIVGVKETAEQIINRYHSLWKPLPEDHPRVYLWMLSTYKNFYRTYFNKEKTLLSDPDTVVYPPPSYKLSSILTSEPNYYADWIIKDAENRNRKLENLAQRMATLDNHMAVLKIKKYYPEYQPDLQLISNPPEGHIPSWWETERDEPTPETCALTQRYGPTNKHPYNNTWCQWCGWREEGN